MVAIVPPARAVWFDLKSRSERLLDPGEHGRGRPEDGFVWIDVDLPAPQALEALRASGLLPVDVPIDDEAAGRVGWTHGPEHLHLSLAAARLDGDALLLDRYDIVVSEGVVSLHTGMPSYFDDLRAEFGDDFQRFAQSHGFLLFEMLTTSPTAWGKPSGRSATGSTSCGSRPSAPRQPVERATDRSCWRPSCS